MHNQDDTLARKIVNPLGAAHDLKISVIHPREILEEQKTDELERMQVAMRSSKSGSWTFDLSKNTLVVCNRCRELIPTLNEGNVSLSRILRLVVPDFSIKVVEAFLLACKSTKLFDIEVPVNLVNGNESNWFRITGLNASNCSDTSPLIHGLIEDISIRKRSEQLSHDVLAIVSHDLRSPLSIIKLYVQLCEQKAGICDRGLLRDMLKKADLQINKMNSLIGSYLELPKTVTGEIGFILERFDFKELLEEVIVDLRLLYPVNILFIKPTEGVNVNADREKIGQVLQNLLSNAIKYSSQMDVISIDFRTIENLLQVEIEDRGIGIKAADQSKIFDRFYRCQRKDDVPVKGYGIGLYLSKQIVKQHQGDIWLKSELNKGTKFYFTLPLARL